ncbi:hypothetical protein [Virgibacillus dokdonensis]|uniref:hypothetical protein n=1 Tax=Virgibacillus dokdonensis TaxID=302167 RepID=UPI00158FDAEF|nr:hypothetical protein [Virgibacillus dokdonensis]
MSRVLVAVVSPIVLFSLFFIFGFIINPSNAFRQEAISPIVDLFVIYIISLLFFLI